VRYRRLIAAADIANFTVINCTMVYDNAVIPQFDFAWNTSSIRVVSSAGKLIKNVQGFFVRNYGLWRLNNEYKRISCRRGTARRCRPTGVDISQCKLKLVELGVTDTVRLHMNMHT